jgi:predicted DNA-binding transcriptional regulator AlpA
MVIDNPPRIARLIRIDDVVQFWFPVSRSTIWRWIRKGCFPRPVHLPGRGSAWRVEDLQAALDALSEVKGDDSDESEPT